MPANVIDLILNAITGSAEKSIKQFSDGAGKSIGGIESAVSSLTFFAKGAVALFAGKQILDGLRNITDAAIEAEDTITSLNLALKLSGDFSNGSSARFQSLAAQIQNTTKFTDDSVMAAVAQAKQYNLNNQQTEKTEQQTIEKFRNLCSFNSIN